MKSLFQIIKVTRSLWPLYILISVLSVLVAVLGQIQPLFIKGIIDRIVAGLDGGELVFGSVVIFAVAFFLADFGVTIFSNVLGYFGDMMSTRLRRELGTNYYQQLMHLPQGYFDEEQTGKIINRLTRTIEELSRFMKMFANNFLSMIMTMILTLGIVAYYSWPVAILLFLVYPVFLYLTTLTSRKWQKYQTQKNKLSDIATGRFTEVVGQIKAVRSFVGEKLEISSFDSAHKKYIEITKKQSKDWHLHDVYRRLAMNLIFLAVLAIIVYQGVNKTLTIGEVVLLVQYSGLMRIPLFSMSFLVDSTQKAISGSEDYLEVMSLEPEEEDAPGSRKLKVGEGTIRFNEVDFSYLKGERVMHDVSFDIPAGSKVALVGESGEGKSTLSNLLIRLYSAERGSIEIDGQDIAGVSRESLRKNIAMVFQEPALFSGTIIENISYGSEKASKKQIVAAAKAANADEFISKFKDGYDTEIGERGIKLSGGQKQRIAIARALLKDAPILVLDEATSSLDSKSEALVQSALERLMKGRTSLIIAHRLSTIADVDLVVTLVKGRVDEIGKPEELTNTSGIYAKLLELQQSSGEARKKSLAKFDIVA